MVGAIALGAAAGVMGFLPLLYGMRLAKQASPTSNLGHAGALLLGVLLSFVVLAVAVVICIVVARSQTVPFALAEAVTLCVCAIAFGFTRLVKK